MYFLFIVNDILMGEQIISAEEIVNTLIEKQYWLYTSNTANIKKLRPGDKVIVYLAGTNRKVFVASFEIAKEVVSNKLIPKSDIEKILFRWFDLCSAINNIEKWCEPVPIGVIKERLNFIIDKKNWGLFFRQATKCINEQDYNLIIQTRKEI